MSAALMWTSTFDASRAQTSNEWRAVVFWANALVSPLGSKLIFDADVKKNDQCVDRFTRAVSMQRETPDTSNHFAK